MWALITHYDGGYSLSYPLSSHGDWREGKKIAMVRGTAYGAWEI